MPEGTITAPRKLSGVETLKAGSRGLRGDLAAELLAPGARGGVSEAAYNLLKFHGSYEQYDRDTATARKQRGDDKDWRFMVRVRAPGGVLTGAQFLLLDDIAEHYGNGTLRLTTRQGVQFHGLLRGDLRAGIGAIEAALLTSYAACGDVGRNVTTTPAPIRDAVHARLEADARMLSAALLPRSRAHHEIFVDDAPDDFTTKAEPEPLYGVTYLPRKFKIGLAHADSAGFDNTVDVLTDDLGLVAVFEGSTLLGYQVLVGGGLGMTHNRADTFPRLASAIGFAGPDDLLRVTTAVVHLHRDHGDRGDRKRARLKYVVEDMGLDWVRDRLAEYLGAPLAPPRALPPPVVPELLGWHPQGDGRHWLGVPVPSGRIAGPLRAALRAIVEQHGCGVVATPQQDVLLSDLHPTARPAVEALLREAGAIPAEALSPLARWSLACPALPTCGLALTEAERVQAPIVASVEAALARHGLLEERISLRITGCPNGCVRTYVGDIGLVGRVPGQYALYVGGDFAGTRLSFKLAERIPEAAIAATLEPLFAAFAGDRRAGEGFGDFCHRVGPEALTAMLPAPTVAPPRRERPAA